MGLWDKDKEMGRQLTQIFSYGDEIIVWRLRPDPTPVDVGGGESANKTWVEVSRVDRPDDLFEVSTLSKPIHEKAELATDEDFPVVCQLLQVETKRALNPATVLQYIRDWAGERPAAATRETVQAATARDDDLPF